MSEPATHTDLDDGVRVLLVDDDPDWLRFTERILRREDDSFSVTTAGSASEGVAALREDDGIDCVVSDYRMPSTDGLEFLRRVREDWPDLPFVLVTGAGSEDVASDAIAAGVDDYLVKDPRRDQGTTLVTRIQNAVENYRLRRQVAASEQRYRTLVEQGSDAVLIVRDGTVAFANERARDLAGVDDLAGSSVADLFPEKTPGQLAAADAEEPFEATLETAAGDNRDVSVTASRIDYEGEPAVLWSVRDVTARRERERDLRQERDIKSALRDVLVDASTREDLGAGICQELAGTDRYGFAWVGEPEDGKLHPATWAGGDGDYLDAFDREVARGEEPSLWAARDNAPQFVDDLTALFESRWREAALNRGYRAVAALPLTYDDLSYGVLAVYATETRAFDERERELLADVAEALAYSIDSVERANALATDRRREVSVRVDDPTHPLAAAAAAVGDDAAVTVRGTVSQGDDRDTVFGTVAGGDPAAFVDSLESTDSVLDASVTDADAGRVRATKRGPTVGGVVADAGGVVTEQTFTAGGGDVVFTLAADRDVRGVVDDLDAAFDSVSVGSVTESAERALTPEERVQRALGDLTEKQAEALRTAHHAGYFRQPRESSADDVAATLDISRSTFLQHLRSGQRKLFDVLFED